jgi:hypothetical protein
MIARAERGWASLRARVLEGQVWDAGLQAVVVGLSGSLQLSGVLTWGRDNLHDAVLR